MSTDALTALQEEYVTSTEAAALLRIHPRTLQRFVREGKVLAKRIGPGWYFNRWELMDFRESYDPKPGPKRRPARLF